MKRRDFVKSSMLAAGSVAAAGSVTILPVHGSSRPEAKFPEITGLT